MEPLDPNDSLWKLLGKARPVEPRSNFTANVLRAARQTPQTRGWWAKVSEWLQDSPSALPRMAVGVAAAVALAAAVAVQFRTTESPPNLVQHVSDTAPVVATVAEPPLLAVETQLESVDQVSMLLALEDTSSLTDSEINFLLY
jgi:hypothetical protein